MFGLQPSTSAPVIRVKPAVSVSTTSMATSVTVQLAGPVSTASEVSIGGRGGGRGLAHTLSYSFMCSRVDV